MQLNAQGLCCVAERADIQLERRILKLKVVWIRTRLERHTADFQNGFTCEP